MKQKGRPVLNANLETNPSLRLSVLGYRVRQYHGKQVLRICCIKFHLLTLQFVVIPHGKRDLGSLPEAGEAAMQIS